MEKRKKSWKEEGEREKKEKGVVRKLEVIKEGRM